MSFIAIEEESGTYRNSSQHPHNGYWAGDFTEKTRPADLDRWFAWGRTQPATRP